MGFVQDLLESGRDGWRGCDCSRGQQQTEAEPGVIHAVSAEW